MYSASKNCTYTIQFTACVIKLFVSEICSPIRWFPPTDSRKPNKCLLISSPYSCKDLTPRPVLQNYTTPALPLLLSGPIISHWHILPKKTRRPRLPHSPYYFWRSIRKRPGATPLPSIYSLQSLYVKTITGTYADDTAILVTAVTPALAPQEKTC